MLFTWKKTLTPVTAKRHTPQGPWASERQMENSQDFQLFDFQPPLDANFSGPRQLKRGGSPGCLGEKKNGICIVWPYVDLYTRNSNRENPWNMTLITLLSLHYYHYHSCYLQSAPVLLNHTETQRQSKNLLVIFMALDSRWHPLRPIVIYTMSTNPPIKTIWKLHRIEDYNFNHVQQWNLPKALNNKKCFTLFLVGANVIFVWIIYD